MSDAFLEPSLAPAKMDRYLPRQAILQAIRRCSTYLTGRCLDVGSGDKPYWPLLREPPFQVSELLGLDRDGDRCQHTPADLVWVDGMIPLPDCSIDSALCTEVLEHCPNPAEVLAEVHRVLKHGGSLVLTLPFLWPLHEVPYDWCRYTPFALKQLLENAGFQVCELSSLGNYDRSLAQMLSLWLHRRPMNRLLRKTFILLLYPIWTVLRLTPEPDAGSLGEGQMITGLMARAEKK